MVSKGKDRSQELLANSVLDNLPGLVFRTVNDGHWTFEYASRGSLALLGYEPEKLVNAKTFRNMIPKEDQRANKRVLAKISREQPHYSLVYRVRTATGETKWVKEEGTGVFSDDGRLVALDGFVMDITEQKRREERLRRENTRLRSNIEERHRLDELIGGSLAMKEVYNKIFRAAASQAPVVIVGESGTGKELAARAMHNLSDRNDRPFVAVNCGAIPEGLIESEFFGYRKGAFSGALTDREGLLDAADGGTLFLDEVGEIPLPLQVKLLRVLDGGGYMRIGDTQVRQSRFRLVAATHQHLEELVRGGRMRQDFYYRINAIRLRMPPLRERREDILTLAYYFLEKFNRTGKAPRLSAQEESTLLNYSWPGNVRELQNVVHRYLALGTLELTGQDFSSRNIPAEKATSGPEMELAGSLQGAEREIILDMLERHKWHIGKTAAALGFSRRTLQRRMKKYNLRK